MSSGRHLYFIHDSQRSLMKVGRSNDPTRRCRRLATSSGARLQLVRVVHGAGDKEAEVFEVFDEARRLGEWFSLEVAPRLLQFATGQESLDEFLSDCRSRFTADSAWRCFVGPVFLWCAWPTIWMSYRDPESGCEVERSLGHRNIARAIQAAREIAGPRSVRRV